MTKTADTKQAETAESEGVSYRVISTDLFYTPGIFRYIRGGFFGGDKKWAIDTLATFFEAAEQQPTRKALRRVLNDKNPPVQEDDALIFTFSAEEIAQK